MGRTTWSDKQMCIRDSNTGAFGKAAGIDGGERDGRLSGGDGGFP